MFTARRCICALVLSVLTVGAANATDWSGPYAGVNFGGADGASDTHNPFGGYQFGNSTNEKGAVFGLQGGWNFQNGHWVYGAEAMADFASLSGTATCLSDVNAGRCRPEIGGLGSLAGRLGYADGANLFFAKAGLAWMADNESLLIFRNPPLFSKDGALRVGWTLGAGLEHRFAPNWSLKFEYDYLGFGSETFNFANPRPIAFDNHAHVFTTGVNYHFNGLGEDDPTASPLRDDAATEWAFEIGFRYFGAVDNMKLNYASDPTNENSRLTYLGMPVRAGEIAGRADHASGWFVMGYAGLGSLAGGTLYDEDTPHAAFGNAHYSNTLTDLHHGTFRAESLSVGFNAVSTSTARLGVFAGTHHMFESTTGFGCLQLATNDFLCQPGDFLPTDSLIAEQENWYAARLGVNGRVALGDGFSLAAEAAYLPYVFLRGIDNHKFRGIVFDSHGTGDGMQLEALLQYAVSDTISVGAGARYWEWHTTLDSEQCIGICDKTRPHQTYVEGPFNTPHDTHLFGGFAQISYHWGNAVRQDNSSGEEPAAAFAWTGYYVSAQTGLRASKAVWRTTCLETPCSAGEGFRNANPVSFANGAVYAGIQVGRLIEAAPGWLWGIEADAGWANNRRTEVNFWRTGFVNAVPAPATDPLTLAEDFDGSVRLRAGMLVTPGTFAYATVGLAVEGISASLLCHGDPPSSNWCLSPTASETVTHTAAGWTAGLGIETALSDVLSARVEYRWTDYAAFSHLFLANRSDDSIGMRTNLRNQRLTAGLVYHLPQ